jgi:hypothetical protein
MLKEVWVTRTGHLIPSDSPARFATAERYVHAPLGFPQPVATLMFHCSLEAFKHMVADCYRAIEKREPEEVIDAAWKCVSLHFLHFEGSQLEKLFVLSYFDWLSKRMVEWDVLHELES